MAAGAGRSPHPRRAQGEDRLAAGDLVCIPERPAGEREPLNRGESAMRALGPSATGLPANICYPDTGHWLIRDGLGTPDTVLRP